MLRVKLDKGHRCLKLMCMTFACTEGKKVVRCSDLCKCHPTASFMGKCKVCLQAVSAQHK